MEPGQRAGSGESGSRLPHSKAFGGGVYGERGWQAHFVRWEGLMRQASSRFALGWSWVIVIVLPVVWMAATRKTAWLIVVCRSSALWHLCAGRR
jgi:hypothetical protein